MKSIFKILMILITLTSLSSFTNKDKDTYEFIGTYGVSSSDPSQIKLSIHSDNTYTYQDFSNPNDKINVQGIWELKGSKVILKNNATSKFHDVWSFDENGKVAKSRKGLCFYRLCRLDS